MLIQTFWSEDENGYDLVIYIYILFRSRLFAAVSSYNNVCWSLFSSSQFQFIFQDGILEEQLRMYLHCCLTLCDFWEPNIAAVTILWEYYSKNLVSKQSMNLFLEFEHGIWGMFLWFNYIQLQRFLKVNFSKQIRVAKNIFMFHIV